jgi:hypothetical protein
VTVDDRHLQTTMTESNHCMGDARVRLFLIDIQLGSLSDMRREDKKEYSVRKSSFKEQGINHIITDYYLKFSLSV